MRSYFGEPVRITFDVLREMLRVTRTTAGGEVSLDEGISLFIGRIYDSVYEADAWRSLMADMLALTDSHMSFVSSVDVQHQIYSRAEVYGPDHSAAAIAMQEHAEEMHAFDPSLLWASQHPCAGVCETAKLMPREDFRKLPYVQWQSSRFGTEHWCVFYTEPVDGLSFGFALHPAKEDGPPSGEAVKLHGLLFDHVRRALRLAARPPNLADSSEIVIILGASGQVLVMSPRAEQIIERRDGLIIERRRLSAFAPAVAARLNRAIISALRSSSLGSSGSGVRLPRAEGADWLALVSPCPRFFDHLPVQSPAAVLRIIETDPQAALLPAHAELFDMSPREVDVAQALLRGQSLDHLCGLLGISRNTAKVHLQSLFKKTGTNRQAELVHLLSNVARP
jgi:DNA-binding CsgD family transcriptional regulator